MITTFMGIRIIAGDTVSHITMIITALTMGITTMIIPQVVWHPLQADHREHPDQIRWV